MKSVNPVKMLSALALVLLVFSVTDGRIMSKCELKAKLDAAMIQSITAVGENLTVNDVIARLVCRANSTAFNTSFVSNREKKTPQTPTRLPPQAPSRLPPQAPSRLPPQAPSRLPPQAPPFNATKAPSHNATKAPALKPSKAPSFNTSKAPSHNATKAPPVSKAPPQAPSSRVPPQAPSRIPPKPNKSTRPTRATRSFDSETKRPLPTEHLFGVFQLSDHRACDSGMVPSLNICKMNCTDLIDDDITNDIACLKILMNSTDVSKMLLVKECHSVVPSKLFANCD